MHKSGTGDFATGFIASSFGIGQKAATTAQDMCFLRRTGEFSQIIDQPGKRIRDRLAFGILFLHSPVRRMHIRATSKWIENASQD
ncbi:hypothetical protein [Rhizobium sp. WYJ-E13]|uniref:hypothetical protein n=1 Tax=Rhizobium sp. WYJ-E13 TaxID=2849093 RepID=UPI001C1EDD23|nr:hypothetical protein [Rhizobium sp. WYJ-E13]QWW69425.1 hypothetical protein KQ933_06900 [Rhizobium sp. WYJ-E13]